MNIWIAIVTNSASPGTYTVRPNTWFSQPSTMTIEEMIMRATGVAREDITVHGDGLGADWGTRSVRLYPVDIGDHLERRLADFIAETLIAPFSHARVGPDTRASLYATALSLAQDFVNPSA